jgi:MOSC domain-containing protein YiiM
MSWLSLKLNNMKVVSLNLGERKKIVWRKKEIETGIYKFPVDSPIFLGNEDVKGDSVVDRVHHGGIEQAVYGYSEKHYDYFKKLHSDLDWQFGMFGENITFDDLNEEEITVGSIYKLGECILEVTKPRQPCYKLGIRFNDPAIIKQFWETSMCGIYFKVLQTGFVNMNDELMLLQKSIGTLTIADVYASKK